MAAYCRRCGAPIAWWRTPAGKAMPVDAVPNRAGNIVIERQAGRPVAVVCGADDERLADPKRTVWLPHWASCPKAEEVKRERKPAAAG